MTNELKITADELFVLGELMDAMYIDYSYIKLMSDIQANYAIIKSEGMASLSEVGLIRESFSGVKIMPAVKTILEPVFFGKRESVLTIKDNDIRNINFHIYGDRLSCVEIEDGNLVVKTITEDEIREEYFRPLKNTVGVAVHIRTAEVAVGGYEKKWDELGDDFENEALNILKGENNGL